MSFYKYFSEHDRVVSSSPLYEEVSQSQPISGWVSQSNSPNNFTQYYSGSYYPLSNHYFDITFGASVGSDYQKINIYNQFAKILLGHDSSNNINKFPISATNNSSMPYAYMINLSRTHSKDRVRYNNFSMDLIVSGTDKVTLHDTNSSILEGAGGHHYGLLEATSSVEGLLAAAGSKAGYVFYEAGIAVVSPYLFVSTGSATDADDIVNGNILGLLSESKAEYVSQLSSSLAGGIIDMNNFIAPKVSFLNYDSVTEINSTIYFCRAFNHEFNYSSNPTYLQNSEIIVKGGDPEEPSRAYITTVGLYSEDNQLVAVAKFSEPILKTKDNELIARVRLDF